ncbi:MAG: CoA pyrophosphatase [Aliishimia sp.]
MTKSLPSDLFTRAVSAIAWAGEGSSDFDLNKDVEMPEGRKLRDAGVLVLLHEVHGAWRMYLTKRSSALRHHPGQIAFPGGKKDETDHDIDQTAMREAWEEIGLPINSARVVGHLPSHITVTGFRVTPVVAVIDAPFEIRREPGEVDEVFTVPLSHVLDPRNYSIQSRRWQGRRRHYYSVPFGPYYTWGATARILRGWADATLS